MIPFKITHINIIKNIINILIVTFIFSKVCNAKEANIKNIDIANGLYYQKDTKNLYSGNITGNLQVEIIEGKKEGRCLKFYSDGKILSRAYYINNILEGQLIEYYNNGNVLRKINFKKGMLDGIYLDYYQMGQLLNKKYYLQGKLEGQALTYYKNGQLQSKIFYKNGKYNGEYLIFHEYEIDEVVQLKIERYFKEGIAEGLYTEYHENGKLRATGKYKNGKLEGEYKKYLRTGELDKVFFYKKGILNSSKTFSSQ